jgi:hypothetical protein
MKSHGRVLGSYIPIWDLTFDPTSDVRVDQTNHVINQFVPTKYMRMEAKNHKLQDFPTITHILLHALGETKDKHPLLDHWLNWFACIFKNRKKPLTAWVLCGTEGTGKGLLFNLIIVPLLGLNNCAPIGLDDLEDRFNAWIAEKLLISVNELDSDDFREKGRITAKLKNAITEPTGQVRYMRTNTMTVPYTAAFMFSTNNDTAVRIPASDRRYNVGNRQEQAISEINEQDVENELQAFAEFLLAHKADQHLSNKILETQERKNMQALSRTSTREACENIKAGNFEYLWFARANDKLLAQSAATNEELTTAQSYNLRLKEYAKDILEGKNESRISHDELKILLRYLVGVKQHVGTFTSLLRHNGIVIGRLRKGGDRVYGIKVEWEVSPELRAELSKIYKQHERK